VGRFIRGLSAKQRYQLQFDDGPSTQFETGIAYESTEPFQQVRINNTADVEQVIEVAIADGYVDDNRLVGQMDLNGTIGILSTAAVSHTTHPIQTIAAATEVLPFNDQRRSALVQCSGEVFIDNSANGIKANSFEWEAQTALILVPVSGSVEVRILEDTNE
jgi:hypothetical protein